MRIFAVIVLSLPFFLLVSSPRPPILPEDNERRNTAMPDDLAAEVKRLQHNQATLMSALNQLIVQTAPIALLNPADASSGYVTTGLVLNRDGLIVPGTIAANDPRSTLRGTRPGDPLWTEAPPTP